MLKLIQRVIAYIQTMMGGATPTQAAGHAPQERTTQDGKVTSALDTKPLSALAKSKPKRKPKAAQPTTQAKSRKAAPKPAQTTRGSRGQSSKTLAPQTQSPAPTKRKSKQEVAPSTTVVAKPGKKRPTVRQVAMVSQSKQTGSKSKTPASKTRQHVK